MANDKLALASWIEEAEKRSLPLCEILIEKNCKNLGLERNELIKNMKDMLDVMESSIQYGLTGIKSRSGLTGGNALKLREALSESARPSILGLNISDAVIFSLAVGEANAAMGRIVAAPTAGASGVLPGALFSLKKNYGLSGEQLAEGLVVAGSIGLVIASRSSISGAIGGCQAECGSAAAMAAGAAVSLLGGTPVQVGNAVAMTIKNMLGLVCDPVAGLVEVPCIKRNAGAVVQAMAAAEMALAGIESFIPPDEAIDAMKEVGDRLPCALKETADGGLAATPTALAWAEAYFSNVKQTKGETK